MNRSLLAALALLPVVAIGGEQVILEKDFGGNAMRKVKYVDGWSLVSYCPGELSREQGTLRLKALPNNGKESAQMLCTFRTGNLTGCEIKLQYKVKGSGKIRFGAVRYREGQKAPDKSDSFKSELMELGSDYKDYEFTVAFGDQPLSGANFLFEIHGEGGEAVIDSMTVTASGDAECVIQPLAPIMVKDTDPMPDVKFQTNRPGKTFRFFTSMLGNSPVAHGGTVAADENGVVTISGKSLLQDQAMQEVFLVLDGNALFEQPGKTGCRFCDLALAKNPTVGSVMITKIPPAEYDASLEAAKKAKLGGAKTILILADSLWDFDRGANAADRMNFFLRKAKGDDIKVVNYAVHGDRIDKMTARFKGDLAAVDHGPTRYRDLKTETPDLIMIMLGHNDTATNSRDNFAAPKVAPEVQKAKYGELLAALKETFPKSKVVLLTPVSVNYEGILKRCEEKRQAGDKLIFRYGDPDKVEAFRKVLSEVAEEHNLPLFDMFTPTDHLDNKPSYFRPDNVHLSPRGYGLVARLVLQEMGKNMELTSAAPVLDGSGIKIEFDSEERGFDCLAIKNKQCGEGVQFGDGASDGSRAGLWAMKFWKDGRPSQSRWLTNHSPSSRSVETYDGRLRLFWKGLSLGDEKDVVDVTADVELAEDGESAKWRIQVRNRSKAWGLAEVEYPIIRHVVVSNTASALLPSGNMGGRLVERYAGGDNLGYPHGLVPVQTLAFMKDGAGLQFTALDGKAQNKAFSTKGLDMKIWYRCPDEGCPGAANAPDYAVETAAFEGNWWVAAKRYRKWALKQQWTSKGPIKDRTDFCKKMGNVGYWVVGHGLGVRKSLATLAELLPDVPLGCHWYSWHNSPFDVNYPEMFPAKSGVKEAAAWMKENGVFCMPYINGSLWEDEIESFTNALPYTCKKPDGSYYTYKCNHNGNVLARMCPTTGLWKKTLLDNSKRLFEEFDVDGVYLDQISCSVPQACHDAAHGHRLGGGDFWTQGYRELMKPIREEAVKRGGGLTSEAAAEPYMDSFDAFLTWFWNLPNDVPLLPAVYSGYALYFGSSQSKNDSLDSYCALQARMFLWGIQLGWNGIIIDKGKQDYVPFTLKLCRTRLENLDCFLYGELVGELIPVGEVPMVDVKWEKKDVGEFKAPAIMSAVWLSDKGERRAFIVNISGEERRFEYKFAPDGETHSVILAPRSVMACE